MNVYKGVYHDGIVEMIENPKKKETSSVLVIFPENKKRIKKILGLFKDHKINYEQIKKDLKNFNKQSEKNILKDYE